MVSVHALKFNTPSSKPVEACMFLFTSNLFLKDQNTPKIEQHKNVSGREPWSSGFGRRIKFWRLWVRIPSPYTGYTFITKRGRGWHHLKYQHIFNWETERLKEKMFLHGRDANCGQFEWNRDRCTYQTIPFLLTLKAKSPPMRQRWTWYVALP